MGEIERDVDQRDGRRERCSRERTMLRDRRRLDRERIEINIQRKKEIGMRERCRMESTLEMGPGRDVEWRGR